VAGEVAISGQDDTHRFSQQQITIDDLGGPLFGRVFATWEKLRGAAFAPPWRVSDMLRYPTEAISFISVVDVLESGEFKYRFWGTGHVEVKGYDYTGGAPLDHEPPEYGRIIDGEYQAVRDSGRPMAFIHDIRPLLDRSSKHQETLRLPLSNDGMTVTGVISFADWRDELGPAVSVFDRMAENTPPL
jgi:hypothetical protein